VSTNPDTQLNDNIPVGPGDDIVVEDTPGLLDTVTGTLPDITEDVTVKITVEDDTGVVAVRVSKKPWYDKLNVLFKRCLI
jgi:hypothetical protein